MQTDHKWIEELPDRIKTYMLRLLVKRGVDEVTTELQDEFVIEVKQLVFEKDAEQVEIREKLHAEMDENLAGHRRDLKKLVNEHAAQVDDMRLYRDQQALSIKSYDERLRVALTAIEDCESPTLTPEQILVIEAGVKQKDNHMILRVLEDVHHETLARIIKAHGEQRPGRKVGMSGTATGTGTAM